MTDKEQKAMSAISMSRKAGKLLWGFDTVVSAAQAGKVKLILLASDLSAKTKKEIAFVCQKTKIRSVEMRFDMQQLQQGIGKRSGVLAVTDQGFSDHIEKKLQDCGNESGVVLQGEEGRML